MYPTAKVNKILTGFVIGAFLFAAVMTVVGALA